MSEHTWFQENIAGYTAGGLSVEERERFGRHRVACAACAKILAEAEGLDRSLDDLFAAVRASAGWENRVIDRLRLSASPRRFYSSNLARIAAGIAAMLVLGTLGAFLQGFVGAGDLAFPGVPTQYAAATSKDHGTGTLNRKDWVPIGEVGVAALQDGESGAVSSNHLKPLGELAGKIAHLRGEALEEKEVLERDFTKARNSPWIELSPLPDDGEIKDQMSLLSKEMFSDKDNASGVRFSPPALGVLDAKSGKDLSDLNDSPAISTGGSLNRQSEPVRVLALPPAISGSDLRQRFSDLSTKDNANMNKSFGALPSNRLGEPASITSDLRLEASYAPLGFGTTLDGKGQFWGRSGGTRIENEGKRAGVDTYYKPQLAVDTVAAKSDTKASNALLGNQTTLHHDLAPVTDSIKLGKTQPPPKEPAQPESPPDTASRKIIRTGEIDFEVDSFDAAVAGITRTVNGIKGAFVTTVNSDKLPNGKVKGSMVVRLPPEKLDSFLLSIRQDLAKIGELKSQRIGSQDVTKQYTDVQSRLRGARAMEERFLQIIKTGKGEIKDLIVAENALGSWRLKIEEMEGEIRYYNNQVGLSTLTITLVEKEIQAPAALIVTQRVKIQLEVDDVDKARQAALEAVNEAKGRITKSELKQHAAGQLEAILHFEVAPAAANSVRDKIKGLGVVTHQDADRNEQTEGTGSRLAIKVKQNDVKFEVGMYNVANIQPREVLVIQIASLDVPAGFRKLQESAAKAKAQVRTAQLNEQDKVNASAQFDFDIPSGDKKAIDDSLTQVGVILARTATQAAPGEAATDRKVGYRLTLRNVAALPSRERISLGIEVKEVKDAVADILDIVKSRQGYIAGSQVNHERSGQDSAVVIFDVPLDAKAELVRHLESSGKVRVQTSTRNPQVPDNKLATAHFDVRLSSATPIVPNDEGLWPQIRTSLFYSFKLLSWSLMCIIVALAVVLPWVILIWVAYKLISKWRRKPAPSSVG